MHTPEPLRRDSAEVVGHKCSLAKRELSSLWARQLGQDEAVVDVARVYNPEKVAIEVLKYAMKGSELIESPEPIAPLLRTLKGSRLLAGWGSMFPLPELDPEEQPEVECDQCHHTKTFLPETVVSYLLRS